MLNDVDAINDVSAYPCLNGLFYDLAIIFICKHDNGLRIVLIENSHVL